MTESRWREIEKVFHEAVDKSPTERDQWLVATHGADLELLCEVRTLLENDVAEPLDASVKEAMLALPDSRAPRQAGPYELLAEIGRGGMGTVYRARRADKVYDAVVAVKLVRPGMDTDFVLGRFRQERQTLAKLNHPNIARLLDGGTTDDGIPYIVMEYIEGSRITDYCQHEKLSLEDRLRLILPVCRATDHAHRNFVVHRDIKPGNIMVDQTGTPKLLDFGICKLLHSSPLQSEETMTRGLGLLTPDYASPEQVRGEAVSVRSDVYSLGAVLYELLTGTRAHRFEQMSLKAIEQAVCEKPVLQPSDAAEPTLKKALLGDLDNIVMRALDKDPQRRYESAAALAEDIRRYLEHEPVTARPAGKLYRAGKFVRRHRLLTAAVTAVLLTSSIGALVSIRQMRQTEARERQIRSLARVFLYDVHDAVRDLPGATAARQKIVHTAVEYLDALAGSHPTDPELVRELAAGYQRIGDLQGSDAVGANLGQSRAALASYSKAIGFWDQLLVQIPADRQAAIDRLNLLRRTADLRTQTEGARQALSAYNQAEVGARTLGARFPDDLTLQSLVADVLTVSGRRHREAGDLPGSLQKAEEALAIAQRVADSLPKDRLRATAVASAEASVGMTKARMGDLAGARKLFESVATRGEALVAADPNNVSAKRNLMIGYSHLGDILGYPDLPNLGETTEAEAVYSKIVGIARQTQASDPQDARAATDLAIALMRWGVVTASPADRHRRLTAAGELFRLRLATAPTNMTLVSYQAVVENQLGLTSEALGRRDEALAHWRRSIEIANPHLDKAVESQWRTLLLATRSLVLYEPVAELRRSGKSRLERAVAVAEKAAAGAKDPGDVSSRAALPRAYGAYSMFHARLGESAQANEWRERAEESWKDLSSKPGFLPSLRKEMLEFEAWRPESVGPRAVQ